MSKSAFKNKDYTTWFISEINRKNFIFKNATEANKEKIRSYLKEMNEVDIDELYLKLPKSRLEIKSLKKLDSYIEQNLIGAIQLKERIRKDYNYNKHGNLNVNDNAYFINKAFMKVLNIEIDLKLITILDDLYGSFIESFMICYANYGLIKEKQMETEKEKVVYIEIEIYTFSFAIRYIENVDLKNIFIEYFKQNYILTLENYDVLEKMYKNICKNFTTQATIATTYGKLFDNFLVFSSWMNLTQKNFDFIIEQFNKKLESNLLGVHQFSNINYFLSIQYYKNKTVDVFNIAIIIKKYISAFLEGKFSYLDISALQNLNIPKNIFFILKHEKLQLEDSFNPKISYFISNFKNKSINDKYYCVRYFLGSLALIVSGDIQKT